MDGGYPDAYLRPDWEELNRRYDNAAVFLDASDSAGFLAPLGDLIVTGPTGTNVVDLTILMAGDSKRLRNGP